MCFLDGGSSVTRAYSRASNSPFNFTGLASFTKRIAIAKES